MTRSIHVGAAQLGPIARDEPRDHVVDRLLRLLRRGAEHGCELVVFPELALTTFFPRWYLDEGGDAGIGGDTTELDSYYEDEVPSIATQPLFDEAKRLAVGFCLGYAELTPPDGDGVRHRYNTYVLVDRAGEIVAKYRKVHIPGHESHEPWRQFQHLERRYFEESPDGFGVHDAFGGRFGMAICNDRRWPETYRVMGLQGVEMILIGYNTPLNYAPDPSQNPLQGFHNHLVMQAGAYQNGTWVVGVAKGGIEEGVESLAQTAIIAPSGQVVAQATTIGDELVDAFCDLDMCERYKKTLFDFDRYRRPEMYSVITDPTTKSLVDSLARPKPDFGDDDPGDD
ncbi:MAG: N-carbamoyl-D-amino-acid hydrolase [Ilumatobacter sp.]